jgi:hypothetical protein
MGAQLDSLSSNSQREFRILCGLAFCSRLSMVRLIISENGGHSSNTWQGLSLGPWQLSKLFFVSVCRPLLLCLPIVSGFVPRTKSWIQSIPISSSGEVKKLVYWRLCLTVLNVSNHC